MMEILVHITFQELERSNLERLKSRLKLFDCGDDTGVLGALFDDELLELHEVLLRRAAQVLKEMVKSAFANFRMKKVFSDGEKRRRARAPYALITRVHTQLFRVDIIVCAKDAQKASIRALLVLFVAQQWAVHRGFTSSKGPL